MFNKIVNRLSGSLGILLSTVIIGVNGTSALAKSEIEALHAFQVTDRAVSIIVTSNGCTKKEDFTVILDQSKQVPVATFIRLKPDLCKAASQPYQIQFTVQEVGATMFEIGNTFKPVPRF